MDESYYYYLLTQLYLVVLIIAVVSIVINVLIGFGCKKMAENKGYKKTAVFIFRYFYRDNRFDFYGADRTCERRGRV